MKLKTEPKSPKSEKGEKRGEVIINEKKKRIKTPSTGEHECP